MKITKLTSDALMGSVTRAFLSFVLCIVLHVPILVNAFPTPEKCSCNFNEPNDRKDGAEVANAAECFLTLYKGDKWCSFDVDSLKNSENHAKSVYLLHDVDSPEDLVNLLVGRFQDWKDDGTNENFRMIDEYYTNSRDGRDEIFGEIVKRLNSQTELLLSCVEAFKSDYVELKVDEEFQCGVHSNGWLTLALNFERFLILYLLGPEDD